MLRVNAAMPRQTGVARVDCPNRVSLTSEIREMGNKRLCRFSPNRFNRQNVTYFRFFGNR